ncbi:hypothetical protein CTZ27_21745 [Streptomyces griseocarneus]|nr:hypothetical protein CTZ27_21745 [Streptomyces griseocarneus]
MRIMFVGDSMTIGSAGDFTWRYRMWQHLDATCPGAYRIVGPRRGLYDPTADAPSASDYADATAGFPEDARAHLAGWGEGWLHMAPLIGAAVRETGADTLLVSLGLIDLGFYTDPEQTAANVRAFIAAAREAEPGVRIVLLPVIRNVRAATDPGFAAQVDHFNELLGKTVAALDAPGSPVLLASAPRDWDRDRDTYDGTHPTPSGEHRLAAAFAEVMHQAWEVGGAYAER